jgi:hypothetical protein
MLKRNENAATGGVNILPDRQIPAASHHVKQHLETVIHVQLLMAMEQRQALLGRGEIRSDAAIAL